MKSIGSDGSVTSMSVRWEIWTRAVQAIGDFALTGIGIDSFDLVIPNFYPYTENVEQIPHAHNLFLQVGVDLGVPGLLFYCWLWGTALWIFIAVLRTGGVLPDNEKINQHHRRGRRRSLHREAALRLVDAVTWGTKLAFLSWLLLALAGALYLQVQQSDDDPQFDL
jgi:putative inorganic carbon (HCO3(-)) transporter